jgi:hypothetical protein
LIVIIMAKKPQDGMDEEEIIRRRDGVGGAASDEPLDAGARRALADARLRALAFALGSEQSPRPGADDTELLAYLLDTLPEQRRLTLEGALRGDARMFGRLVTLRGAFNSQTDKRDRQRADDPARKIPRRTVGHVDVRSMGQILQFRNAQAPRRSFHSGPLPSRALETSERPVVRALQPSLGFRRLKRPRFEWGEKSESMLRNLLERARRDLDAGRSLVNEAQSSLERWWDINRREESETREGGAPADREAETVHERLTEVLRELEMVANRINDELGDIASTTSDMFPAAGMLPAAPSTIFALSDALFPKEDLTEVQQDPRSLGDRETWEDMFDLEAGAWALHLTGTALPTPQLAVSLRGNHEQMRSTTPFLTLVQPAEGFETVNLDSSGSGKIALPAGESVMLLQGDEVWEVRLSFR